MLLPFESNLMMDSIVFCAINFIKPLCDTKILCFSNICVHVIEKNSFSLHSNLFMHVLMTHRLVILCEINRVRLQQDGGLVRVTIPCYVYHT